MPPADSETPEARARRGTACTTEGFRIRQIDGKSSSANLKATIQTFSYEDCGPPLRMATYNDDNHQFSRAPDVVVRHGFHRDADYVSGPRCTARSPEHRRRFAIRLARVARTLRVAAVARRGFGVWGPRATEVRFGRTAAESTTARCR